MSATDWENVARCARARYAALLAQDSRAIAWWGEWESWQTALELSGRCPI